MADSKNMYQYIHFNRQNFLDYRNRKGSNLSVDINSLNNRTKNKFLQMTREAKQRADQVRNISKQAQDIMSLIASTDNIDQLLNGQFDQVVKQIQKVRGDLYGLKFKEEEMKVDEQITKLENLIESINIFRKDLGTLDEELMRYYEDNLNSNQLKLSLEKSFEINGKLKVLNINKTALTSLKSLGNRVESIDNILKNSKGSISNLTKTTVSYIDSKGNNKTVPISEAIGGIHQLILNILGGIGEGVVAFRVTEEINKLLKPFSKIKNVTYSVEGVGNTVKKGNVSKSDVNVSYDENGVKVNIGISAKAKYVKKGGKTSTVFQTSPLKVFLNGIFHNVQYNFLNNLYQKRNSLNEQISLNRYIAAMNFDNAVTGVDFGDNVLFLSYLDQVITIEDFYQSILNSGKYPKLTFQAGYTSKFSGDEWVGKKDKKGQEIIDLTPEEKNILAWQRSNAIRNMLLSLQTQITVEK